MQDIRRSTPEEADTFLLSPRKVILFTTLAALVAGLVASLTSYKTLLSPGFANGSVNQNIDPSPFVLSTPICPWCGSMIAREMYNPKPKPTLEPLCLLIPSTW